MGAPFHSIDLPGEPVQIITRHWARGTEVPWGSPVQRWLSPPQPRREESETVEREG